MSYLPGKFVWFEHQSSDTALARSFYEPLFGWHVEPMPLGDTTYQMIQSRGSGIGGVCDSPAKTPARWQSYLSVDDVDAAYAKALKQGAHSENEPRDYGPVGRGADIVDPVGAHLALWKSAQEDMPDVEPYPDATFCWNELWASDAEKGLAFYQHLIGYGTTPMNMGEQGTYHLLTTGEKMRGGLLQSPAGAPPMWLPYVQVADCDATAALAGKQGATVCLEPQDVPEVGRIAIFIDPQGASLGLITSVKR